MNVDFSAVLVLLTAFSGIVCLLAKLAHFDKRRGGHPIARGSMVFVVDTCRSFFPIFLIVLILRSFIVEPFKIPSNSMMPTLLSGDFILVNKFNYGLRLPVLHTNFFRVNSPKRGDVVVFRYPLDPAVPYIKRVVGLPGDTFSYRDKILHINGQRIEHVDLGTYNAVGSGKVMNRAALGKESLGDTNYHTLHLKNAMRRQFRYVDGVVPADHYFVLGDNRDNSKDSRYWGFVPEQNLMGRAFMIWMNWDWKNEQGVVDWSRIGTMLGTLDSQG